MTPHQSHYEVIPDATLLDNPLLVEVENSELVLPTTNIKVTADDGCKVSCNAPENELIVEETVTDDATQAVVTLASAVTTQESSSATTVVDLPHQFPEAAKEESKLQASLRKAGVAVAGGVMVGVGLVMIPLPTPCGCVVAGAGLGVLATEFPEAQRIMDTTRERALMARDRLVESIERTAQEQAAQDLMQMQQAQEGNENATPNNESEPFMNAKERERQEKLLQDPRRPVTRTAATSRNSPVKKNGVPPEATMDAARRTFLRTASHLGQSVLPFLKSLDSPAKEPSKYPPSPQKDSPGQPVSTPETLKTKPFVTSL